MRHLHNLTNALMVQLYKHVPWLAERWARRHRFVETEGIPWVPLRKPLQETVIALVTTAGVHLRTQPPFDMDDPNGDPSCRVIPSYIDKDELVITHKYYDHTAADKDLNVVLPLDRLQELKEEGLIGGIAPFVYGFMGHIDGPHVETLLQHTAPEVARLLTCDGAEAVVLTPAWGLCNQTVGLLQRAIEAEGIPTVGITLQKEVTQKVKPPRALYLRYPFGHPLGEACALKQQRMILLDALRALETISEPGTILEPGYLWRRHRFE